MSRKPQTHTRTLRPRLIFAVALALFAAAVSIPLATAWATSTLSDALPLPGDTAPAPAADWQEQAAISKGASAYLAVWADSRTITVNGSPFTDIGFGGPYDGVGLGTMKDIYAARVGADGQVIDTTPIVVAEQGYNQASPRVGWNGENWLVVWYAEREQDRNKIEVRAARVSPGGQLLDATPITLDGTATFGAFPRRVIADASGNFVVVWDDFSKQGGNNRSVFAARVSPSGQLIDLREIYSGFAIGDSDIARAGDRYLLSYKNQSGNLLTVLLDSNFNQARNGPDLVNASGFRPRVASNGDSWAVVWTTSSSSGNIVQVYAAFVAHTGDVSNLVQVRNNIGVTQVEATVEWDGSNWFVTYNSTFDENTGTYDWLDNIQLSRVAPDGTLLDPKGVTVTADPGVQYQPAIAPGPSGGAQVVWGDNNLQDVRTAAVSASGAVGPSVTASLGAPRQLKARAASSGNGFLFVFRDQIGTASRVMGQHLDAEGVPVEQEPFVISDAPNSDNPSVAWNGTNYLVVWDAVSSPDDTSNRQTFARVVPSTGPPLGATMTVMSGLQPDVAALNGTFLVSNILQETAQIRSVQAVRADASGTPLGPPAILSRAFHSWPRAAAFGPRWLVVWEAHSNHDDSPGSVSGSFVSADGTFTTPVTLGNNADDRTPHLAVNTDATQALIVWTDGDIRARRVNADGSSPEAVSGMFVSNAAGRQAEPAVAWDGQQYVVTWLDQRNYVFPQQPRGDIRAARVSTTNVPLEEFAVSDSVLPEETPFVVSANGLTVFSYARFYDDAPPLALDAYHTTIRTAHLPAPDLGNLPAPPSNLVVTLSNNGAQNNTTLTWADNSGDESGFKLESGASASSFSQIKLLPANTTTVGNLTTPTNTLTLYRVRAYSPAGDSEYSAVASAPVAKIVAPAAGAASVYFPANVSVVADATDPEGVTLVEFYSRRDPQDGQGYEPPVLIGSLSSPDAQGHYALNWTPQPGRYVVYVKAFDSAGSSTETPYSNVNVRQLPTASITAPAEASTFTEGADISLNASAQTNNGAWNEFINRLDFYDGTRWIGQATNTEAQGPWSFTWRNAPVGEHTLTAHASSNTGELGISAPVHVTVKPATDPEPDLNIKPHVMLTSPITGASFAAGAPVAATATASDDDGTVARVEFRADGRVVETDTSVPYSATLNLTGGTHQITAVAFDNRGGSTASATSQITIDRPTGAQLTSTTWDFQHEFGPSAVAVQGPPVDEELADDFQIVGDISRVVVNGARGFSSPSNPAILGAYVRFYAWENGNPGALQDEQFLAPGDAGLVYDTANPATLDITLPHSFRASGKHFLSVQLVIKDSAGYWYWHSAHKGAPQNSAVRTRDNYAGGTWGPVDSGVGPINADAVIQLYGVTNAPPTLGEILQTSAERSGFFVINGNGFGSEQGSARVLVGSLAAIVVKWTDAQVVGYVPEAAPLGANPVVVSTPAGDSNALQINVAERQSVGRIRWQTKYLGDRFIYRPAVAPSGSPNAGSVYAQVGGLVYAWSPTGALLWVARSGDPLFGGDRGQITVGQDGTVYFADLVQPGGAGTPRRAALTALNSLDGSVKWRAVDSATSQIYAGPNAGPDGKVYVVFAPGQYNTAAFRPDGTLAWSRNDSLPSAVGGLVREIAFARNLPRFYFNAGSPFIASDFDGNRLWTTSAIAADAPSIPADDNLRVRASNFSALDGHKLYDFPPFGQGVSEAAAAGIDNTHYIVESFSRLYAVNPDGTEKWHYDNLDFENQPGPVKAPNVSPSNSFVVMGARSFSKPGYFVAVNPATGQLAWRQPLPDEPAYNSGEIEPFSVFAFTADGSTAYTAGDVLGSPEPRFQNTEFGIFYAFNTTPDNVPINQPPVVTLTSPRSNTNIELGTAIDVSASVQDDGALDRVEFFYNYLGTTTKIATVTAPAADNQYRTTWTPPQSGGYGVYAVAYDAGGLRADSEINGVSVHSDPPKLRWVSPVTGDTFAPPPASIDFNVNALGRSSEVTLVEFYVSRYATTEGEKVGEDSTPDADGNYQASWANPPEGQWMLSAKATDALGHQATNVAFITVSQPTPTPTPTPTPSPTPTPTPVGQPPVVSITSPADGASFPPTTGTASEVPVTVEASDPDGTIARVELYRGFYNTLISTDFNAPYSFRVSSGTPSPFDLYAVAYDNAGNRVQSAPIRIFFQYPDTDPRGQLSISGRAIHKQSTPGNEILVPHALVKLNLNNQFIRTTQTDDSGFYVFDKLSRGGRYQVIPAEPGYTFEPPSIFYEGLIENESWDFVADGPLPNPTPTPTPGANSLTWEKFFDGSQHLADFNPHVAVDSDGNTYVAATSGSFTNGDTDITTIKYSPAGQQLWAATFASPGGFKDWAADIKVDSAGNVYVAGAAWAGAFSGSEYDVVTIKYDTNGNRAWAKYYNGPIGHWDIGYALALDSGGNVLVAGSSQASKSTGALYDEFVTVKYDPNGNQLWARRRSTQQIGDDAFGIAVDASGGVYVSGGAYAVNSGVQTRDVVTVKYDAAGTEQWASRFTGTPASPGPLPLPSNPVSTDPVGIGLDPSGNVYVFGANDPGSTETDYLLLKYDPATGALVWNRNWSGESIDYPRDMAIDAAGNVYLTGESWDGEYNSATSSETWDVATVKFDGAGTLQWARIYRGFPGKIDGGREVELDPAGNVYVGGFSEGFNNGDAVVIKYKADGTESWVYRYDNPEHTDDSLRDMAADASGNIYLAGQAILTNGSGQKTLDLVTAKLAASTIQLNSPPNVTATVEPVAEGGPANAAATNGRDIGPTGPTIAGIRANIVAQAADLDGTVVRVDFYDGKTKLGTATSEPYTFRWDDPALGTHAVIAAATDNSGATRSSQTFSVTFTEATPTPTPTPAPTPTPTPTPTPAAVLSVLMTADRNPAPVGLNFNYKATLTNTGNAASLNTVLTDVLPTQVTFTSASATQGTCSYASSTRTVTCNLGAVPAGGNAGVTITVKPREEGMLNNTANVSAAQWDAATGNGSASVNGLPAIKYVDVSVTLTDSADPINAGENTVYTLVVKTSNAPISATGVTLQDTLPSGMTFVSAATSQGSLVTPPVGSTGIVTANIGTMAPNATVTVTVTAKGASGGTWTNTAQVSSNETDSNTANNNATQATTVKASVVVGLQKILLAKQTLTGGCESTTGQVYLTAPAPAGGASVSLSKNISGVSVPAYVNIPAGATVSPAFTVNTNAVTAKQTGLVTATSGPNSVSRGVTINVGGGTCP